jgi:hypothetical protein
MSLSLLQAIGNSIESFNSFGDTYRAHGHSVNGLEEEGVTIDETSDEERVEPLCRAPGN